jgi:hypothetical protein
MQLHLEVMLKRPVSAAGQTFEALHGAVARRLDAVPEQKGHLGHHPGYIDAGVVSHIAALVVRYLKSRELLLGDLAPADRKFYICVVA